jgi:tetratricopeptide (TPR) repeat protein
MRETRLVMACAALLCGALALSGGCTKGDDSKKEAEEEVEEKPKEKGCQTIEGTHAPSKRIAARKKRPQICKVTGDFIIGRYVETLEGYENLEEIGGRLDIRATGSLKSLKGLSKVKRIGGGIWLREAYSLGSLDELPALTTVGGGIHAIGNPELSSISLPALQRVEGDIEVIHNRNIGSVSFPALTSVMGNVTLVDNELLSSVEIPVVETILGHIRLRASFEIRDLAAPKLTTLWGGIDLGMNPELAKVSLPALKQFAGEFLIEHNNKLKGGGGLKAITKKAKAEPTSYEAVVLHGKNLLVEPFGEKLLEKPTPEKKLIKMRTARLNNAIKVCSKAHGMSRDRAEAMFCLAEAHELLEQPDKAIPFYRKALEIDPKAITAFHKLALIYKEKGDLGSAREAYKKCIANGGDSQDAIPCKVELRELDKKK